MRLTEGTRVWLSGDSAELWIEGYDIRVSSGATVEESPSPYAKKVLLTIDNIDGEGNVLAYVRKSKLRIMQ